MVRPARTAAIVTWAYAAAFGLPAVPVGIHLTSTGRLPSFYGLFDMYGGPWSTTIPESRLVGLLLLFGAATLVAAGSARLLWKGRRSGAALNVALLPVEAVFWIGFALPLPWVTGLARLVLVAASWPLLSASAEEGPAVHPPRWGDPA